MAGFDEGGSDMSEGQELMERRLSRQDLLKLAAAAGGAGLLAGHTCHGGAAALDRLAAESGRLQVLDWAGYGYDGGQTMFAPVRQEVPEEQAEVHCAWRTRRTPSAKFQRGRQLGHLPSVRRLGEVLRRERPRAALGPEAHPELQAPQPAHGQGGPVQGKAVRDPGGLGLRRDPLPDGQGEAEGAAPGASCSTSATRARSRGTTTPARCSR